MNTAKMSAYCVMLLTMFCEQNTEKPVKAVCILADRISDIYSTIQLVPKLPPATAHSLQMGKRTPQMHLYEENVKQNKLDK